jgi:hypothetical protein
VNDNTSRQSAHARRMNVGTAITIRSLGPRDLDWPRLLERCDHDFYHLPGYVELEAQRMGGIPKAFAVTEGRDFIFLPLVIRPIPLLADAYDGTSPYGYPGLLQGGERAHDPRWLRRALDMLLEELAAQYIAAVFVRLHPLLRQPKEVLREFGDVVEHGETVVVDLSVSEDRLFGQMRLNHRRVIRRLRAAGITARIDDTWARLDDFVKIYHQTMEAVGAARSYFFPHDYLDELRRGVGSAVKLSVVERRGELLAAGIFSQCCGIVQYHLGATSSAARVLSPSRLMLYSAFEWAKTQGNMVVHLGGGVGGRTDSLFHFKAGFSPVRATFATWRAIPRPSIFRLATQRWEAATGQRSLDTFFPPYREGQS